MGSNFHSNLGSIEKPRKSREEGPVRLGAVYAFYVEGVGNEPCRVETMGQQS